MLNTAGIHPQIFDAVEPERDPVKGCYYSHYSILRDIFVNGYEWAIVLEDDVDFDVSFKYELIALMDTQVLPHRDSVEMVFLGVFRDEGIETGFNATRQFLSPTKRPWGTIAYLISKAGALNLFNIFQEMGDDTPADAWWEHGHMKAWNGTPLASPHRL